MARVKIEEIIEYLSSEMKGALERAVERSCPGTHFDRNELFREFLRAVGAKCGTWEQVPDHYVEAD